MEKLDAINNFNTCIANNQTYKNTKIINTKLLFWIIKNKIRLSC